MTIRRVRDDSLQRVAIVMVAAVLATSLPVSKSEAVVRNDSGGLSSTTTPAGATVRAQIRGTSLEDYALGLTPVSHAIPETPSTSIVDGPYGTVETSVVSFTFTADVAGASFECRLLDITDWDTCAGPVEDDVSSDEADEYFASATENHFGSDSNRSPGSLADPPHIPNEVATVEDGEQVLDVAGSSLTSDGVDHEARPDEVHFSYEVSGLEEGRYTFMVRAVVDGRIGTPASRSWTVAFPDPIASPLSGADMAGSSGSDTQGDDLVPDEPTSVAPAPETALTSAVAKFQRPQQFGAVGDQIVMEFDGGLDSGVDPSEIVVSFGRARAIACGSTRVECAVGTDSLTLSVTEALTGHRDVFRDQVVAINGLPSGSGQPISVRESVRIVAQLRPQIVELMRDGVDFATPGLGLTAPTANLPVGLANSLQQPLRRSATAASLTSAVVQSGDPSRFGAVGDRMVLRFGSDLDARDLASVVVSFGSVAQIPCSAPTVGCTVRGDSLTVSAARTFVIRRNMSGERVVRVDGLRDSRLAPVSVPSPVGIGSSDASPPANSAISGSGGSTAETEATTPNSPPPPIVSQSSGSIGHGSQLSMSHVGPRGHRAPSGRVASSADGQVIENLTITASEDANAAIVIRHNNVTIRNVHVIAPGAASGIRIEAGTRGTVIDRVSIDGRRAQYGRNRDDANYGNVGVKAFGPFTMRRSHVFDVRQGVQLWGQATASTIVENWIGSVWRNAPGVSTSGVSYRGSSANGATTMIARNRFEQSAMASITLSASTGPVVEVTVQNNLIVGTGGTGYGIRGGYQGSHRSANRAVRIVGNTFAGEFMYGPNGGVNTAQPGNTFTENRWTPSNALIAAQRHL